MSDDIIYICVRWRIQRAGDARAHCVMKGALSEEEKPRWKMRLAKIEDLPGAGINLRTPQATQTARWVCVL